LSATLKKPYGSPDATDRPAYTQRRRTPNVITTMQPLWNLDGRSLKSATLFPEICSFASRPGFLEKLSYPNRIRSNLVFLTAKETHLRDRSDSFICHPTFVSR
jgi:hypothetical protein